MSCKSKSGITVEKTLHMENAFVTSMNYTSLTKPVLTETVSAEGGDLVRVSEDNGKTWTTKGQWTPPEEVGDRIVTGRHPVYFFDEDHKILIEFVTEFEKAVGENMGFGSDASEDYLELRTGRIFYRFSKDEGRTWGPRKQLIQKGPQYDEVHWADGICYEKNSCNFDELLRAIKLKDGAIIVPVWFWRLGEDGVLEKKVDRFGDVIWPTTGAACFRGQWREDLSDIDWEMSNHLTVPEYMSRGLGEPAIAELDDGRLMVVLRADSNVRQTMSGVKFFATSRDGGRTWGPAVPLTYPDNSFVHSPGSLPNLFRSSKNGKLYLITNILSEPTRGCDPRNVLQIAEVDQKYFWVLPETVTVIDKHKEHHPRFIRFSNWQRIEDRQTGNPVIYMTEGRIDTCIPDTPGEVCPHSYRYEINLPEAD